MSASQRVRSIGFKCYPLGERTEVQRSWLETKGGRALYLVLSHEALVKYRGYQVGVVGVQHVAWGLVKIFQYLKRRPRRKPQTEGDSPDVAYRLSPSLSV